MSATVPPREGAGADAASSALLLEQDATRHYEHAPCGFLSVLPDGAVVRANATFLRWVGRDADDINGRLRLQDVLAPAGRIYLETHVMPLLLMHGAAREISLELLAADGTRRPVLLTSVLDTDRDGRPALIRISIFDASERHQYERELRRARDRERESRERAEHLQRELAERNRELERLAFTDPLTGVDNRRALQGHLGRAIARARRQGEALAVALVDLDHFKRVNDRLGHAVGDAVLLAAAGRMRAAVRREDVVGRWGGEEFLVVAPAADEEEIQVIAERVREALDCDAIQVDEHAIGCSASIGWATWDGDSLDALLTRADRALYCAKQDGRNRVSGDQARC